MLCPCVQTLRDLKAEIEHIQRLLETNRVKMQGDFESWFSNCLERQAASSTTAPRLRADSGTSADTDRSGTTLSYSYPSSASAGGGGGSVAASHRTTMTSEAASSLANSTSRPPLPMSSTSSYMPAGAFGGASTSAPMSMPMPMPGGYPSGAMPPQGWYPPQGMYGQVYPAPPSSAPHGYMSPYAHLMPGQVALPFVPGLAPSPRPGGGGGVPQPMYSYPLPYPPGMMATPASHAPYGSLGATPYTPGGGGGGGGASTPSTTVGAPSGIKLTGNAEADADILAFYKAKEELMKRTKSGGSAGVFAEAQRVSSAMTAAPPPR